MSVLDRRVTVAVVALLLSLATAAWWVTAQSASGMAGMVHGLAHVGTAMPLDTTAPMFLAMWTTMMVAMMFPTVAPIVLVHRLVIRRRGRGPGLTVAFASGYLAVWAALGLVPLALLVAFRDIASPSPWVYRLGGAALVVAGVYQFSRWKQTCLSACRSPLTFLATHDFGTGVPGVFRAGVAHGLYCAGCCWALMAVLFVVGLMNLAWMAAIAVVFLLEKNWRRGPALTKVVGSAVALVGAAVLINPGLLMDLAGVNGSGSSVMPTM